MTPFLASFRDELIKIGAPKKVSRMGLLRHIADMTPEQLKGFGLRAGGIAAINKALNPGVSVGDALLTGGALEAGGSAGHRVAQGLRLGGKGRFLSSLGGAAAAAKLLWSVQGDKRRERAREELFGE